MSTELALAVITGIKPLNTNWKMIGLFIDFENAFDLVSHHILLKLEAVGVRVDGLEWFPSFLTQRFQLDKIQNRFSKPLPVIAGVRVGCAIICNIHK